MLQINTGKFHTRSLEYENDLTGVLYSNARLLTGGLGPDSVTTAAGILTEAGRSGDIQNLVFEMVERIEETTRGPGKGVLISHTVEPYLPDMAVIASFSTQATIWNERDTVRRLIEGVRMPSGYGAPNTFVRGVFKVNATILPQTGEELTEFVELLFALQRDTYLRVIRALTLLITGLHRLVEDISLSYALMVAAIETVATNPSVEPPLWGQLDGRKRKLYSKVLKDMDAPTADTLKKIVLEAEHAGASHRFREFVLGNLGDDFFRRPQVGHSRQISRYELLPALHEAYSLRSNYIHDAKRLPDPITHPHHHAEVTYVDRVPVLTHQGLYEVARKSILNFVLSSPKIESEQYNYEYDRPGIVRMQMAAQYWVGKPLPDIKGAGRRVEGILSQLEGIVRKHEKAALTDIRPIMEQAVALLPQAKADDRQILLIFLALFNQSLPADQRWPGWEKVYSQYGEELWRASRYSVVMTPLLGFPDEWAIEDHHDVLDQYFKKRTNARGIHAPRLFEAAACIVLAERYRIDGNQDKAKELLNTAADIDVGNDIYLKQLDSISFNNPFLWDVLLLPAEEEIEKD